MMRSLFVISDLHLGGDIGFQMCSPHGQSRLAEFIRYIAAQKSDVQDVHLVLNGDVVDFLAEKEFSSFTNDDAGARAKLEKIIKSTHEVWDRLHDLVVTGARLTLMLGNHDTELSLPGARQFLMETIGGGHVEFIYDNQALVEGSVLIEHGNRYDKWNVISHDVLRSIRSAMSRGETPAKYLGPPGSQLVQDVMNPIKEKYPFVDLLKPENSGVLPILAVLEPSAMKNIPKLAALAAKSTEARFDDNGIPIDQQNIAATTYGFQAKDEGLELALSLAGMGDQQNISATSGEAKGFLERLKNAASEVAREKQLDMLLQALRYFANTARQAFNVGVEGNEYLSPAKVAAARGYKVIIYGHTHLAKRISLPETKSVYLNTGTWADLMKVPDAIFGSDEALSKKQLVEFLDDIEHNRLDAWRCQVPTFARVDFDNGALIGGDIFFYEGGSVVRRVPDGQLSLLNYSLRP